MNNGLVVDACGRTSDTAIFAAGDCAVCRTADGGWRRLESVHSAVEQARSAAAALLGRERPFVATPWFYSDQHDVKLQILGLSRGSDKSVIRGSLDQDRFSIFYYRGDSLIAVDTMNQPAEHMVMRKLFDGQRLPTPQQAADPAFELKNLLAAAG